MKTNAIAVALILGLAVAAPGCRMVLGFEAAEALPADGGAAPPDSALADSAADGGEETDAPGDADGAAPPLEASTARDLVDLANQQNFPVALAVDATGVYWVNRGFDWEAPSNKLGSVWRYAFDENAPVELATDQAEPNGIRLEGNDVYWVNNGDGSVMRAPKAGGTATVVARAESGYLRAITTDRTSVYWGASAIRKAPLGGGAAINLVPQHYGIESVVVDPPRIFWVESGDETVNAGKILSSGLDGSNVVENATGQAQPQRMRVNGENIYWANASYDKGRTSAIMKQPRGSVVAPVAVVSNLENLESFDIDATAIYYVDREDLMAVALDGGAPTQLLADVGCAQDIVVDATKIYWADICNKRIRSTTK